MAGAHQPAVRYRVIGDMVRFSVVTDAEFRFTLIDASGQVLYTMHGCGPSTMDVPKRALRSGVHFVRVISASGSVEKTMVR